VTGVVATDELETATGVESAEAPAFESTGAGADTAGAGAGAATSVEGVVEGAGVEATGVPIGVPGSSGMSTESCAFGVEWQPVRRSVENASAATPLRQPAYNRTILLSISP
jgi:hypothetical protein